MPVGGVLSLAFLIVAVVLASLAAFSVASGRFNLLAGAVAFFAGAFLAARLGG